MGKKITILVIAFAIVAFTQPAYAQQAEKVYRIGTLFSGSPASHGRYVDWFRQGLRVLGYVEGKNFIIVPRWGMGKLKRLPKLAAELVEAKVDVILVTGHRALGAAGKATQTIPIVVGIAANLVKYEGFVASLARPGGNVTGSTFNASALSGKRLGLLREALPSARRVAFLYSNLKRGLRDLKRTKTAGKALGLKILPLQVETLGEIERAIASMVKGRADALIFNTSSVINLHRKRLTALAITKKIPTMCEQEAFAHAGCLLAYSADRKHMMRRAAVFVDKIFKGAKPAELPVETATRYNMVVNLNTAKALGITLPPTILLQATDVIE